MQGLGAGLLYPTFALPTPLCPCPTRRTLWAAVVYCPFLRPVLSVPLTGTPAPWDGGAGAGPQHCLVLFACRRLHEDSGGDLRLLCFPWFSAHSRGAGLGLRLESQHPEFCSWLWSFPAMGPGWEQIGQPGTDGAHSLSWHPILQEVISPGTSLP